MKNPEPIQTVDKSRHAKLRIKPNPDFVHAQGMNLAGVMLGEFGAVACNFPIVFIEHPDTKLWRPVAVLGLRPGENVFYGKPEWDTTYVPMMIQRYPFAVGYDDRVDDDRALASCIDTSSPFISETEGLPLFTPEGNETDFMVSRHMMLRDLFESEKVVEEFATAVRGLDLLTPVEILLQPEQGEGRRVTGMFTINQKKLAELTPEQVAPLLASQFLAACYIMITSLFQFHKLMILRNRRSDEPVTNYRIELEPQPQPAA